MALIPADSHAADDARRQDVPPGGWPLPESIYIHVPFCRHRCGYCNFSVVADRDELIDRFLRAIDIELASLNRPVVHTVFVGGGTPTHLSRGQLDQLLVTMDRRLKLSDDFEWSIEANPEDISAEKLDLLAGHGVNRISLGVQSFDAPKLRVLQRGHTGDSAVNAIEATASRIGNVSIDLIFAAPGETLAVWKNDLETATSLPIRHLSTYGLTIEKGTRFWSRHRRGDLPSVAESIEVEMYQLARTVAAEAGLAQYEISNFSEPRFRCRHNLSYWDGQGWYAAGPGAARFVAGHREVNHRSTTTYLRRMESGQSPTAESERITVDQYVRERAAFGIRMTDGIDLDQFQVTTGVDLDEKCCEAIEQSIEQGLLRRPASRRLCLTQRGILFADTVASRFLG